MKKQNPAYCVFQRVTLGLYDVFEAQKSVTRPFLSQSPNRVGSSPFTLRPYSFEISLFLSGNGSRAFMTWYVRSSCLPSSGRSTNSKFGYFFSMVSGSTLDIIFSFSNWAGCTFYPIFASSLLIIGVAFLGPSVFALKCLAICVCNWTMRRLLPYSILAGQWRMATTATWFCDLNIAQLNIFLDSSFYYILFTTVHLQPYI